MSQHFDLIALGGGSGGLAVAGQAAQLGRRVAIVEADRLGGTCVNRGCVPKKVMWYAAHLADAVADAPGFGVRATLDGVDWPTLVARRDRYVGDINDYWDAHAERLGITRVTGFGRFLNARTLEVGGVRYSSDHIVIATGGRPLVPRLPGAELGITSDGFFALGSLPRRVAVIGGGYIGVELAGMLRALGSQVTLIALEDRLLWAFEPLIGETLAKNMVHEGVDLHPSFEVAALEEHEAGISLTGRSGERIPGFDTVIWAVGRVPNSSGLGLDAAGVAVQPNGLIPTDDHQSTNVPGVYAIGDVTGREPLTPVAIAAGRRLARRLFGGETNLRLDYAQVPTVVFTHPPVGKVGLTQPEAREVFGDTLTVYETRFTPMRYALNERGRTAHGHEAGVPGPAGAGGRHPSDRGWSGRDAPGLCGRGEDGRHQGRPGRHGRHPPEQRRGAGNPEGAGTPPAHDSPSGGRRGLTPMIGTAPRPDALASGCDPRGCFGDTSPRRIRLSSIDSILAMRASIRSRRWSTSLCISP